MPSAAGSHDEKRVDLVFEGGGVKGIGLAGAVSTLLDRGFQPQNLAGASAGAITAALVAAGYTPQELKRIILELDYRAGEFPLTERLAFDTLFLPLYPGLREEELESVVAAVAAVF